MKAYAVGEPVSDLKSHFFLGVTTRHLTNKAVLNTLKTDHHGQIKIFSDPEQATLYAKSLRKYSHYPKNSVEKNQVAAVFTVEIMVNLNYPSHTQTLELKQDSKLILKKIAYQLIPKKDIAIESAYFPDSRLPCFDFCKSQKTCAIS